MPNFEAAQNTGGRYAREMSGEKTFQALSDKDKLKIYGSTNWQEVLAKKHQERQARQEAAARARAAGENKDGADLEKARQEVHVAPDNDPAFFARVYDAEKVRKMLRRDRPGGKEK